MLLFVNPIPWLLAYWMSFSMPQRRADPED